MGPSSFTKMAIIPIHLQYCDDDDDDNKPNWPTFIIQYQGAAMVETLSARQFVDPTVVDVLILLILTPVVDRGGCEHIRG
jgi:hypothetical protein